MTARCCGLRGWTGLDQPWHVELLCGTYCDIMARFGITHDYVVCIMAGQIAS